MQPQIPCNYNDSRASAVAAGGFDARANQVLHISTEAATLRVAIVVDAGIPSAAVDQILRAVTSAQIQVIAVVLEDERERNGNSLPLLFKLWRKLNTAPDKKSLFSQLTAIRETGLNKSLSACHFFANERSASEYLERSSLDLTIHIGDRQTSPRLQTARYGVWRIPNLFSAAEDVRWFWKMFHQEPIYEITSPTSHEGATTSSQIVAALDHLRISRNRTTKLRKMCELLSRSLQDLLHHRRNCGPFLGVDTNLARVPTNFEVAKFWFRWLSSGIPRMLRNRLFREHWFIAVGKNPETIPNSVMEMAHFEIVKPPKERFYADPFLIRRNGRHYLFFEDYPFDHGKGVISFMEIDHKGNCGAPQIALEQAYHLSYPYLFEHAGEVYMLPESLEKGTVDLYRATNFPQEWQLEKTLLEDVSAVDPTILFHNGRFWLFVGGVNSKEAINEDLYLFYSDSLHGPWLPHKQNPIVSDVRRGRPAGRLFYYKGQLVRPSQDCSPQYGRAVGFNRVDELSPTDYRETPVAMIGPEWSKWNRGTHTFNQTEELQVVDGRVLIPRFGLSALASRITRNKILRGFFHSAHNKLDASSLGLASLKNHPKKSPASELAEAESTIGVIAEETTRKQIRGSGLLVSGYAIELLINFLPHLLLVRYLMTADYGAWAYALSLVAAFQTFTLCLNDGMQRFVPIYQERREYGKLFGCVLIALASTLIIGGLFVGFFYLFPGPVARLFREKQSAQLLRVLMILVPLEGLEVMLMRLFACFHRARLIFYLQHVLAPATRLLLVLLLIGLHANLAFLAEGRVWSALLMGILYAATLRKLIREENLASVLSSRIIFPIREMLTFSSPMIVSTALSAIENAAIILLLDRSYGVTGVAFYRVVLPIALMNNIVMNAFSWLYVPSAARLLAKDDYPGINHLYWRTAGWISVLTFPIFAITFCFAGPLATLLYGQRYAASGPILAVLALAYYSNVALGFNGITLKVLGRIKYVVTANICTSVIRILLALLLIPKFGGLGAAIAVAVSMIGYNTLMQSGLRVVRGIKAIEQQYLAFPALLAGCTCVLFCIRRFASGKFYVGAAATSVLCLAVLIAAKKYLSISDTFPEARSLPVLGRFIA